MVHRLITAGSFNHIRYVRDSNSNLIRQDVPGSPKELRGMLGFIDGIDRYNKNISIDNDKAKEQEKLSSKESLYRQFLLFSEFYAAPCPVLICEGNTDNVYLVHAIRSLVAAFPTLAKQNPNGTVSLNVRILKYSGRGTGRILGISGGSANLAKLIRNYDKAKLKFKAPGMKQPVIVVIDNDNGADPIHKVVAHITGKKPTGNEPSIPVTGNLYVVPTPLSSGASISTIEDCFDATTKAIKIGGKAFDAGNNTDTATHYGKMVFAHKVVRAHADKINFSGFNPLLINIASVIDSHQKANP
jgi:hypothetical protein